MSYFLRRLPIARLLLLCGTVLVVGVGASALALALGSGPTPPPKPLAEAVHDALTAPPPEGVSARIQLTNHLLEGANLASGSNGEAGQLSSSPLISGASGRLWISKEGHVRMELQSEKGDTELVYDGHTVSLYEGSSNTIYRYTPKGEGEWQSDGSDGSGSGEGNSGAGADSSGAADASGYHHEIPSVAKIEEGITHLSKDATLSGATPTDVAGQPTYTVHIAPSHNGGLIGGAELSWDAVHGVPLRVAIYSSTGAAPVVELAVSEISYEPVPASVFAITPLPGAKVKEVSPAEVEGSKAPDQSTQGGEDHPKVTTHGEGLEAIALLEGPVKEGAGKSSPTLPEALPKVQINGATATELPTPLGTLLSFERSGVRYLLAGAVSPATIEAFARGL
ncbi:MAG TPA: hypothetical protein VNY52_12450 [Solirubrobacteraceae bacterium]|jgi:outer membrane lipoprotein-sorting protein|nr:hypothetical protein [Solirubrobacteraceae bacterium]